MNMTKGTFSVRSMNYTGIRLVLPALFVMCICSCASSDIISWGGTQ